MIAEAGGLVDHRGSGDLFGFGRPLVPVFPGIAADPAGHNQDAEIVGHSKEVVAVGFAFEADGV
jgi:hypothetical protein